MEGDVRPVAVGGHQGNGGGQVAAGAVAPHGDAGGVAVYGRRIIHRPDGSGIAVFRRAGELGLRGQPVVHGDYHAFGAGTEVTGRCVGRFQVSNHPAAAVEPGQYRERPRPFRSVDSHGDIAVWTGNGPVFHLGDLGTDGTGTGAGVGPGFLGGHGMRRGQAEGVDLFYYRLCLRV